MSALIFLKYDCEAVSAAMALALLHFKNAHTEITLAKLGRECEREAPSIHEYICGGREMPASCWLKLTAKWPELEDRLIYNLDEAEKAFRAKQRELRLPVPETKAEAA